MVTRRLVLVRSLVLLFLTFSIKREAFTSNLELNFDLDLLQRIQKDSQITQTTETYVYSSIWQDLNEDKHLKWRPTLSLSILLLLSGDVHPCPGPVSNTQQEINDFCYKKGFKMFHQNIRGLKGKYDEIQDILYHCKKIDIFSLTELFVNENTIADFNIPGYEFIKRARGNGPGGGVGTYIRNNISFKIRKDLEDIDIEAIWIEIFPKRSKSFIFCVMYKPPESSKHLPKDFSTKLSQKIEAISKEKKEAILMGDLNTNYLELNDQPTIKEIFDTYGFFQQLTTPTRITINTSTLIDVILTNRPTTINDHKVIAAGLSDHNLTACSRKLNNTKYLPKVIKIRDFSKYNVNSINTELSNENWESVYQASSANTAYINFKSILENAINRNAPLIDKTIKGKPAPWLNRELKQHMNIRDELLRKAQKTKNEDTWIAYRRKKNFVINELKRSKRSYFQNKLREDRGNPNRFWKTIKNLFPLKAAPTSISKTFDIDGTSTTDNQAIAEAFCKFFSSIASKLKSQSFLAKNLSWKSVWKNTQRDVNEFQFKEVSELSVLKKLKKLKRKCAMGIDNIPASFLKDTALVIAQPLACIINLSLKTGVFPEDLKLARVTPIYKSGSRDLFNNYRPISVLPVLSKIYEKCVHQQIIDHLEINNLLSDSQFGFRAHRSTELATIYFTDHIRKAMDSGQLTGAIYIDLSKAFDTINHSAIVDKLPNYGVRGISQMWFANYLSCRMQKVSYQGSISSAHKITCGVPQGSILGPLLFILYLNDSVKTITTCNILMYADDTVLFYSDKDPHVLQNNLQKDFNNLATWLTNNELIVNTKKGKTEIMLFGTNKRLSNIGNTTIKINHNENDIGITNTYKYLGLTLTSSLNMTTHLTTSIKKASSRIRILRNMRNYMDSATALIIYQVMIVPILTYCSLTLYGSTPPNLKKRIEKIEDRARLVIGGTLGVPTSDNIIKKRLCVFVHKCLHDRKMCSKFNDYFEVRKTIINTRGNGSKLSIPKVHLEAARKAVYYQGTIVFNKLPKDIRQEKDFKRFKEKLKNLVFIN